MGHLDLNVHERPALLLPLEPPECCIHLHPPGTLHLFLRISENDARVQI
jgi:hypothetical protein